MFRPLSRPQLVIDVIVAGVFALGTVWPEIEIGHLVAAGPLSAVLVVVVMAAALALRRVAPGLALGVAWIGAIVQMAFGRPPGIADIAVFGVLYTSAAYGTRRVFWAGLASVVVGAFVVVAYLFAPTVDIAALDGRTISTAAAMLVAALFGLGLAWTVGALVRTGVRASENRRARERAEAQSAAEAERARIARDMHDVVAHSLAVVIAQADGARYAGSHDPGAATAALGTISSTARAALADVRMLLTQLRYTEAPGPQPTLGDLERLYAQVRSAGVHLQVDVDPAPRGDIAASVQLAVFRILQEALTNALRHGADDLVDVALAWHDDRVEIMVANAMNPAPTSGAAPDASRGHGVIGMRERAQLVGGTLQAGAEGERFVVRAVIPRTESS